MTAAVPRALIAEHVGAELSGRTVIEDVSLTLRRGRLLALLGPNGAGKTTLVRALVGLLPAHGSIRLDDQPMANLSPRQRARTIAYLPQGHTFAWPMPVASVVALGRIAHADPFSPPSAADAAAVRKALASTATEALAERPVTALSGGERARVALARALAAEAPFLLADEPTVSLDPRHQLVVMELLRQAARGGTAVLVVVHDLALAARFADSLVLMANGRIVADGPPQRTLTPERIAAVFGVEASTIATEFGQMPVVQRPL
ncbi:MAG TPA: ABC transporter ATP-binding protein [Xanthobacteraceae bacterium]|nr:ABC transporter ATP-binding protein [Xanthobacteraceae bacterium]